MIRKHRRDGSIAVEFVLPANIEWAPVSVVGNFNDWQPHRHPLIRRPDCTISTTVICAPGAELRFRYLGNGGVWFDELAADWIDGDGSVLIA